MDVKKWTSNLYKYKIIHKMSKVYRVKKGICNVIGITLGAALGKFQVLNLTDSGLITLGARRLSQLQAAAQRQSRLPVALFKDR